MEQRNSNIFANISLTGLAVLILFVYGVLEFDNKYEFLIPYIFYALIIFIITMGIAAYLANKDIMVLGMIILSISCLVFLAMIVMLGLLISTVLANELLLAIHNICNLFK